MNFAGKAFLGILTIGTLIGCGSSETTTKVEEPTEPYSVTAEVRDIVGYTMLDNGTLFLPPSAEATVFPKYRAPVEQVMTSVGQRVRQGEVLIQLNFPNAEAAYEAAQMTVRDAETALANAQAEFSDPLKQAESALAEARSIERRIRSETDPSGDATALAQARQQREAAEQAVAEAKRYRDTNVAAYRQQVEAAREAASQARTGVKQGSLRAPISGVVTDLNARAGEVVGENSEEVLVRIVDLGAFRVKARIPKDASVSLEKGQNVAIRFKEMENQVFDGKVVSIDPLPSSEGGEREVTVSFQNDEGVIKKGFNVAWVGVKVGEAKDVIAVPVLAVKNDPSGKPTVNVLKGSEWEPRVVEVGLSDGEYIEIKSGLEAGETVQVVPAAD